MRGTRLRTLDSVELPHRILSGRRRNISELGARSGIRKQSDQVVFMRSMVRCNWAGSSSGRFLNRLRTHSSWISAVQRARNLPDSASHIRKSRSGAGCMTQASETALTGESLIHSPSAVPAPARPVLPSLPCCPVPGQSCTPSDQRSGRADACLPCGIAGRPTPAT